VYKPTGITKQKILMYANQEKILFEPNIRELVVEETNPVGSTFSDIHPLISCLAQENFDTSVLTKTIHKKKTYYGIKDETMDKIKLYFNEKIFSHIHYTRFEECEIECSLKDVKDVDKHDGIVLLLQINYVLTDLK